ncbi:MAG: cbb3-type cytochrome c oxidase subunit 3 [Sphingomonadales bacterium]|nr:cbb3-type cytochrome c oxidase subunit 3 [Sphingomonadales bacterium]
MTYEGLREFAGTWGLVFLVILFLGAVAYALWPSNKDKFEHASRLPLEEDDGELRS